jgi:hypothetical protein
VWWKSKLASEKPSSIQKEKEGVLV